MLGSDVVSRSLLRVGVMALVSSSLLLPATAAEASTVRPFDNVSRTARASNANAFMSAHTPTSRLPNSMKAPPMDTTHRSAALEMKGRTPQSTIRSLGWSQIPGAGQYVATSPDGSIYVVSDANYGPLGSTIWHYSGGVWSNVPGIVTRLSVAPDLTLWAVNGSGGIYHYVKGVWTAIAGGANDISVAADGSVYAISSAYGNPYGNAIFHYVNGIWSQIPGSATRIAASWDPNSYPGGIVPGGAYVVNALGSIFYYNPHAGFFAIPGAASQVAPTGSAGLFAIGYPLSETNGDPIYYDDLDTGAWQAEPGAAVSIAANSRNVYAIGATGGIYVSPVAAFTGIGSGTPLTGPSVGPGGAWGPTAVANSLRFPVQNGFNGTGYTVAIVAPGNVYGTDLATYSSFFQTPNTSRYIDSELIDGASSAPNSEGSEESTFDAETVESLAPGANIRLYVLPKLDSQSIIDGYNTILSDGAANIVTSSFGGCEADSGTSGLSSIFQAGTDAGIAFVASSGDSGNACFYGNEESGKPLYLPGVQYPASDPNVTAVGGTETNPPAALTSNVTWNDYYTMDGSQEASGGGVSNDFSLPTYQQGLAGTASTQLRNVPDISMPADAASILFNGSWGVVNGTSWGAPQYAAMLAEVYQYCGTAFSGAPAIPYLVNQMVGNTAFIDVISGNNQYVLPSGPATPAYAAGPGYDNATGIGVPLGIPLAQTLCPNGIPAFSRSLLRSRNPAFETHETRATRSFSLNITPRIVRLAHLVRKPQADVVRIQIVLKPRATVASDEKIVLGVLRSSGFSIERTFKNHLVVDATASTGNVEHLFTTQIVNFSQGRFGNAYAPATPITVPASLAPYVSGITLDNVITMATPHRTLLHLLRSVIGK